MFGGTKRLLAMLLACTLTFGTLAPMTVYAEEPAEPPVVDTGDIDQPDVDGGQEEGCDALGHSWTDADCDTAKTCSVCGETEGEALGHNWTDAEGNAANVCSVCSAEKCEVLGHSWTDAGCDTAKTCSVCGETEGEALGHSWEEADGLKVCSVCGAEDEKKEEGGQDEYPIMPASD